MEHNPQFRVLECSWAEALKQAVWVENVYVGQLRDARDTSPVEPLSKEFIRHFSGQYLLVYGESSRRRKGEEVPYKAMVLYHSQAN